MAPLAIIEQIQHYILEADEADDQRLMEIFPMIIYGCQTERTCKKELFFEVGRKVQLTQPYQARLLP
jgi:hypothetical protein